MAGLQGWGNCFGGRVEAERSVYHHTEAPPTGCFLILRKLQRQSNPFHTMSMCLKGAEMSTKVAGETEVRMGANSEILQDRRCRRGSSPVLPPFLPPLPHFLRTLPEGPSGRKADCVLNWNTSWRRLLKAPTKVPSLYTPRFLYSLQYDKQAQPCGSGSLDPAFMTSVLCEAETKANSLL